MEGIDFQPNLVCCPGICVGGGGYLHFPRNSLLGMSMSRTRLEESVVGSETT